MANDVFIPTEKTILNTLKGIPTVVTLDDMLRVLNFSPGQPRDEVGRWSSGGGGGKASMSKRGRLTREEKGAIDSFSGSWGHVINDLLRKEEMDLPKNATFKEMSQNLDSAISKSQLDSSVTLYRGMRFQTNTTKSTYSDEFVGGGRTTKAEKDVFKGAEGGIIKNPGYTSTTSSRQSALNFAKAQESAGSYTNKPPEYKSYVLELKVPKGTKALDMGDTGVFQQVLVGHEKEILLARGSKMKIHSITQLKGYDPGKGISSKSTLHVVKATLVN